MNRVLCVVLGRLGDPDPPFSPLLTHSPARSTYAALRCTDKAGWNEANPNPGRNASTSISGTFEDTNSCKCDLVQASLVRQLLAEDQIFVSLASERTR